MRKIPTNLPDPSRKPGKPAQANRVPVPAKAVPAPMSLPTTQQAAAQAIASMSAAIPPSMTPSAARRARKLIVELAKRKIEALKLYEPLPVQAEFHESKARTNILRGSNRGGKTLPAAVEVARAVTGEDPHGKYPKTNGRCFVVGKDLAHVGEVMWRKLSRAGAFKIIRDKTTGKWRTFRPWTPEDAAREAETKLAPPLIPPRLIKSIAWVNKKASIPSKVVLKNGWEIRFYSSEGKPPRGSDIDLWWFDEEILDEDWYPEMVARILDRRGRGIWSATPQSGTDVLYDLHERAAQERTRRHPSVREFIILLAENPHLDEDVKRGLEEDLTDDERRVRIGGEFALIQHLIYPEFSQSMHCIPARDIPGSWTRFMVVDPGHTVCAVLFAAVPPPGGEEEHEVHLYRELYLRDCDATKFAEAVVAVVGGTAIELALIDPNFSIVTEAGSGKTVAQQYSEALAKAGFKATITATGFIPGNDDVDAGITAVHALLRPSRETNKPRLRVHKERMPNWIEEIKRYSKKKIDGKVIDKPNQRKACHLMDDTRYLALYDPKWIKPREHKPAKSPAIRALEAKKDRRGDGKKYVNIGPRS